MRLKHSALTDVRASALPRDQLPVYRIDMKRTAWVLTLLLSVCAFGSAQANVKPECPEVFIVGPAGIVQPGQTAVYTASVKTRGKAIAIGYVWSASHGKVVKGQGTTAVEVMHDQPELESLTVTLEVTGLPSGCPNTASESSTWDPPPQAEKLDQFTWPLDLTADARLGKIREALDYNSNSQLYVFTPSDPAMLKTLRQIVFNALSHGYDPPRITFVENSPKNGLIQFWLVPPGATPPSKCDGCDPPAALLVVTPAPANCPTLEVTGPSGVTARGTIMPFVVLVSEPRLKNLSFAWSVSTGTIAEGQGTRVIKVRAPAANGTRNVVATVTVQGLPQGCRNVASGTAEIAFSGRLSNEIFAFRH